MKSMKYFLFVNKILKKSFCQNQSAFFVQRKFLHISKKTFNGNVELKDTTKSSEWESIIGLEIHAQINAKSKLFSESSTVFGAPTNTQVSYFDAALPGTLPVCNRYCIEAGILTALALNCKINKTSSFDRKHYFYSDLPAGYQITQQFNPLATDGYLKFHVFDVTTGIKPYKHHVRLKQLQLEQDSGHSFHIDGKHTLIDLNRAGIGLMELVFEPDLKNGLEASMMVKELQLILKKLGTCTCIMEEGALRVDANISVNKIGEPWGVRTEVKNINSNKFIANAIDYEIKRQIQALENGDSVANETRSYDYKAKETVFMRDKEVFQDYRFYPEPNLPQLKLYDNSDKEIENSEHFINIDELRSKLPTLPSEDRDNFMRNYNLKFDSADRIVRQEGLDEFFKSISEPNDDYEHVFKFLTLKVQYHLKTRKLTFQECPLSPSQLREVYLMEQKEIISELTANDVLDMLFNGDPRSATEIVKEYNWFYIADEKELEGLCVQAMRNRPKMVKKYRNSSKRRYMASLLDGLQELCNNRASAKVAEDVFIKLITRKKETVSGEN